MALSHPSAADGHIDAQDVRLLEQAFAQASAFTDGARQADWLSALRDRQPALADAVQALLDARAPAADFFDRLAEQAAALAGRALQPGESVGHYRIVETLGAGGMGVVYRAHDERLARDVALKFVHPDWADDAALKQRFVDEARAASRLDHPHICTVHEIAETPAGQTYIVMALCPGVDLATRLAQSALTLDEVLRVGLQVTDALSAAHSAGVVHRDLKPANLIVDDQCRLRLVDFGIATIVHAHEQAASEAIGTRSYMAPEQLRGEALDARCDIWAVGVTLYEALSGRRPFGGGVTRLQRDQAHDALRAPPPVGRVAPGVPDELDAIVMRCLSLDADDRFGSAAELRDALRQVQHALRNDARANLAPALASTAGRLHARVGPEPERGAAGQAHAPEGARWHQATVLLQRRAQGPTHAAGAERSSHPDPDPWAATVARFGGRVIEPEGPAGAHLQAAVFGYPLADEFAAQRAVRAALALPTDGALALASGRLWSAPTGHGMALGGPTLASAQAVLADTGDGECHLAPSTHALVQRLVASSPVRSGAGVSADEPDAADANASGRASAGAVDGPTDTTDPTTTAITAHRLRRSTPVAPRFAPGATPTPFVGRVPESAMLDEAWERAGDGACETVLVAGEPGIGKSRLVHEFKTRIDAAGSGWTVTCFCAPHQSAWSLHPVASGLLDSWLAPSSDVAGTGPAKISAALESAFAGCAIDDARQRHALRRLFNQPTPAGVVDTPISAETLPRHTLDGLIRMLSARAAERPGLVLIEDLHWADPSTLEWMDQLRRDAAGSALLLLGTHRPGFRPSWGDAHDITRMALARLRRPQAEALLAGALGGRALDDARRAQALERSEGNPLFIEELAAAMLDASAPDSDHVHGADGTAASDVPLTLSDTLMARLDRLGEAKAVAQTAAVLGREFDRALLRAVQQAVHDTPTDRTDRALRSLEAAGLVQRRHPSGDLLWFKHALVRDAAYDSIGAAARPQRHRAVADVLLGQFADRVEREPAGVARHLQLGGAHAQGAHWFLQAARQAHARHALAEAQAHVQHGLDALSTLPPSPETLRTEVNLQLTLGPTLMALRGYADPGVAQAYGRARALFDQLGELPNMPALFGYWTYLMVGGQHPAAAALAQEMVALGRAQSDPDTRDEYLTEALMVRGVSHYFRGELREAAQDLEDAFSHYRPDSAQRHILNYGQDATMIIRSYQVWNCGLMGEPERADAYALEAVASARAMRHPFSIGCSLNFAAWHAMKRGRMDQARELLAENIAWCKEQKLEVFLALASALDAVRRVATGDVQGGGAAFGQALALYNATGARLFESSWSNIIAQGELAAGQIDAAGATLDQAFAVMAETDERWCEPDLWRVRALQRGLAGDAAGAAEALALARQIAERQGAVAWVPDIDATAAQLGLGPVSAA